MTDPGSCPEEKFTPGDSAAMLDRLHKKISAQKIPAGALTRMWALSTAQARIGMNYLACWLRSGFADHDEKEAMFNEAHVFAALKLVSTMGYLRGAVMKVGQMLGNLPMPVPDRMAELLGSLHFEAPLMHYTLIREVFFTEMDAEPEDVFADFDRKPFAAASLGQVHRARLKTGGDVAVKIQYPHMAETIRSDIRNLRMTMGLARDWDEHSLAEIETMLNREIDYIREAAHCREIGKHFAPGDNLAVPKIFNSYSGRRVLTMEYLPGGHLDKFLAGNPNQNRRDHYAELVCKAMLRLHYGARLIFADPNPGNFIFMPDGRLGLIDFGCIRHYTDDEWELQSGTEQAILENDSEKLDLMLARTAMCRPENMAKEHLRLHKESCHWWAKPMMTEGRFDFGDENNYRRGMKIIHEIFEKRYTRGTPVCVWLNRFGLGLRAFLYRLGGRVDYATLARNERERNSRV